MQRLGQWITDNPIAIVALALILTLISFHFAQAVEMQGMNTESMVGKESSLYQIYDHLYKENFGTESIAVMIEGDDVAGEKVLKASLRFSDFVKDVPRVTSVTSIADIVADTEAETEGVRQIPSQERIDEILADGGSQVQGLMPDRRHTMMSIEDPVYITDKQRSEILAETKEAVNLADFPPGYTVTVTGSPALMKSITDEMSASQGQIMILAAVLMVFALLLVFRHVKWPLLPIPVVFLGIIWTFGAMGLFKIPMTMVSFSAFPLLIGIGIDYAIQFHNRIDEEFAKGESPVKAAINTVNHVAIPVMVALVVTIAGFVALLNSSVPMIRDFGKLCIIGLVMCYLSALFVGVTVLWLGEKRTGSRRKKALSQSGDGLDSGSVIGSYVERIADFCIHKWKAVLAVALIFALTGNYLDNLVPVETDTKNYIPQDLPPLVDFKHMSNIYGGTDSIQFIVQGDDITDPENLQWMDDFSNYLIKSRDQVYGATSLVTYIKQANNGMLPDDRTEIRQIIDSLPANVRSKYLSGHNMAMIDVNLGQTASNLGLQNFDRLTKEFEKDLAWVTPPPDISVKMTGNNMVSTATIGALTTGRVEMSLLGLVLIFFLLLLIYRGDLIKALLPVLPMLVVIGWMGGVMYLGGLKYTPLTATLGALVLGIGSEYAILMMERFYEELHNVGDPFEALKITANRIGSALVASGMTVVCGFAALMTSPFNITSNFGLVTVMAVVFALATTFTVFVVLMLRMEVRREVLDNAGDELRKALRVLRGGNGAK
ncbi:MAG: RND family transporter [Methanothrix sp.]|nr:MAG: RND family transporter [Methanothrix sp.]